MTNFKKLSLIITILFLSLTLFACTKSKDKTKVVIWHSSGEQQNIALEAIINKFNFSQNAIEVIAESQPSANFLGNVYSAVANGVGPDIIFNYASTAADYIVANKIVNLNKYFNLDELQTLVPKAVYDECSIFGDDNLYCLPLHSSGPVLFYNKDLYNELNLSVPNSWYELENNAKIIYEEKGIPGFGADSLTDLMQCLIMQSGTGYIDVEDKKVLFNTKETVENLEWFGLNVRSGYFTNEKDGDYFYSNFNAGLIGSFIASCGCEEYITIENYGVAAIPQMNNEKWVPSWNRALIVFKSTIEKEDGAVEFIKYFTNPENSVKWCMASGNISPYAYARENEEYKTFLEQNKALLVVDSCKTYTTMLPTIAGSSTVRNELDKLMSLAISADISIQEILNDAEKRCNDALMQNQN